MTFNTKVYSLILLFFVTVSWSQTQSPKEFLGYELGDRFTRHHQVIDYFKYVANTNTNVKLVQYGETNEHRPLELAFITSPENFSKLEEIRINHLKSSGLVKGVPTPSGISIVWLSYNVHGNEASSTEAAMKTLHALVDSKNTTTKEWLKNTIVILDPCINPDGRERYVNWYNQKVNTPFNTNPDDLEHHEPWPGGRFNHYLFDLNRDWAWISQTESASRIKIYNEWLPNIHVDFHEQGINAPYYFAPAAEPYHEIITKFQHDFQVKIGKNHAKYFDKNGWLYFTKEFFDLLYPSYGDTYPTFNGAIGMTYEQAGHGRAGLGILTRDETVLTLKDRIAHHYTTGLSTIEVASKNSQKLVNEFKKYFDASRNPKGKYLSYVIKGDNGKDKINSLKILLDAHKIEYGSPVGSKSVTGFSYQDNTIKTTRLQSTDMVINVAQPKARLIKALFEPQTKISDSATYDITAWALPYARGLKAYALGSKVGTNAYKGLPKEESKLYTAVPPYAYLAKWNDVKDAEFLAHLLLHKVKVRFANKPFKLEGKNYAAGTLIITKRGNEKLKKFNEIVIKTSKKYNRTITAVTTGFVDQGKDFGSSSVTYLKAPKIALLTGDEVSPTSYGAVWHFFDQQLNYPVTNIGTDYFNSIDLRNYSVVVIPNGYYSKTLNKSNLKKIKDWVRGGGKLIVMDRAVGTFARSDAFSISNYASDDEEKEVKNKREDYEKDEELMPYEDLDRHSVSNLITGSVFKTQFDNTNQLGFGYPKHYYTLKLNSSRYAYIKEGYNVSVIKSKDDKVSGFAGKNALENTSESLVFGIEQVGRGQVVYLVDDPLFRSFWQNGKLVFCNALFFVGQR